MPVVLSVDRGEGRLHAIAAGNQQVDVPLPVTRSAMTFSSSMSAKPSACRT